jgi:hypothetical protein
MILVKISLQTCKNSVIASFFEGLGIVELYRLNPKDSDHQLITVIITDHGGNVITQLGADLVVLSFSHLRSHFTALRGQPMAPPVQGIDS